MMFPVAANAKIYSGSLVCANSSGYATPATDTAGLKFLGVAAEQVDNTGGANSAKWINIYRSGSFQFDALSITQVMVGNAVYVVDDHTVDDYAGPSNDIRVGILVRFEGYNRGWVDINK
jgi:hypothetical protein